MWGMSSSTTCHLTPSSLRAQTARATTELRLLEQDWVGRRVRLLTSLGERDTKFYVPAQTPGRVVRLQYAADSPLIIRFDGTPYLIAPLLG